MNVKSRNSSIDLCMVKEEDMRNFLLDFIEEKNTIYDLNYPDVAGFIIDNREALLKILE